MKKNQIGMAAVDLCRQHGISDAAFYKWRSQNGGLAASEAKRLKILEDENCRLKKLLPQSVMDVATLHEMLSKNFQR